MRFNLTPSIEIETLEDLELALEDLSADVSSDWVAVLRSRGEYYLGVIGVEEVQALEFAYNPNQPRDKDGKWTAGGRKLSALPNGADPDKRAAKMVHENNERVQGDFEYEREVQNFRERLPDDLSDAVRIRVNVRVLARILEEGVIRTQHDTGSSAGMFNPKTRDEHEHFMFNKQYTRPVYGYVHMKEPVSRMNVSQYGNIALVMKPDVVDRTTFTIGDSLHLSDPPAPARLSNVRELDDRRLAMATSFPRYTQYVEAQIHGKVNKSDIEEIIAAPYMDAAMKDTVVYLGKQHGIPVRFADDKRKVDVWGGADDEIIHFTVEGNMRPIAQRGDTVAWASEEFDPDTDKVELRTPGIQTTEVLWQQALKFGYWEPLTDED